MKVIARIKFSKIDPVEQLNPPREFPRGIAKKELPYLNLIDDVIDACIECGIRGIDNKTDWVLIKGQGKRF